MSVSQSRMNVRLLIPTKTIMLILLIAGIGFYFGAGSEFLIFDRAKISQGEYWRLISGHFVHIDREHLLFNLCALLILGGLMEYLQSAWLIPALMSGVLTVSMGLWFGLPSLMVYCGLSGVLNSLLAVLIWRLWAIYNDPIILILGLLAILKIFVEMSSANALFSTISWPPIPEAHLLGMLGGLGLLAFQGFCNSGKSLKLKGT